MNEGNQQDWPDQVLSQVNQVVLALSERGQIEWASPSSQRLVGYRSDLLVGATLSMFRGPRTDAAATEALDALIRSGRAGVVDVRWYRSDGTAFVAEVEVVPGENEGGGPRRIAIVRNVTKRRLEDERASRSDRLRRNGLLARGIAHDFNNLLMGLLGRIQIAVAEVEPSSRAYRLLEEAEGVAFDAATLVRELLDFASEGLPVRRGVDLPALVLDVAGSVLADSSIEVDLRFEALRAADRRVLADPVQIRSVVVALMENARNNMREEGQLTVRAVVVAEEEIPTGLSREHRYLQISFTDSGPTPSDAEFHSYFDPFPLADDPNLDHDAGLALASAWTTTHCNQGLLEAEAGPGGGVTVRLLLQIAESEQPTTAGGGSVVPIASRTGTRALDVVWMDDDGQVLDTARSIVRHLGWNFTGFRRGEEVLRFLHQADASADLLVLDVQVPQGMGGLETLDRVHSSWPELPVLVVSGGPVTEEELRFHARRNVARLTKPFDIAQLRAAVLGLVADLTP